jgi:hypothetical protein
LAPRIGIKPDFPANRHADFLRVPANSRPSTRIFSYMNMNLHTSSRTSALLLAVALVASPALGWTQSSSSSSTSSSSQDTGAKQDMKNAGQDTKSATKNAAQGTKQGTKKAYNATKNGTDKAANKTKNTTKGAVQGAKDGAKQPD